MQTLPPHKKCRHCGHKFYRREEIDGDGSVRLEFSHNYRRRVFCGYHCVRAGQAEAARKKKEVNETILGGRRCRFCQKVLVRHVTSSQPEALSTFRRRQYCNSKCWGSKRTENRISTLTRGGSYGHAKRAMELAGRQKICRHCGATDKTTWIEMHHIDGNWRNNIAANLVYLCRHCHNKEHPNNKSALRKEPLKTCRARGCSSLQASKNLKYCCKHERRILTWGHPDVIFAPGHGGKQISGPKTEYIKNALDKAFKRRRLERKNLKK